MCPITPAAAINLQQPAVRICRAGWLSAGQGPTPGRTGICKSTRCQTPCWLRTLTPLNVPQNTIKLSNLPVSSRLVLGADWGSDSAPTHTEREKSWLGEVLGSLVKAPLTAMQTPEQAMAEHAAAGDDHPPTGTTAAAGGNGGPAA